METLFSNPLFYVVLVVLVAIILFVVRYFKNRKTYVPHPDDFEQPLNTVLFNQVKQQETPQQGEEEIQQVLPHTLANNTHSDVDVDKQVQIDQAADNLPRTRCGSFNAVSTRTDELPANLQELIRDYKPKTLEEKLAFVYYFHSKEFVNAHRYSAAGKFVKVDVSEEYPAGYKLVVAYAVVGKGDKFSRVVGRQLAEAKLNDASEKEVYDFPVSVEELQVPGRTFGDVVKSTVPFTVLNADVRHNLRGWYTDKKNYHYVDAQGQDSQNQPSEEEVAERDKAIASYKAADYKHLIANVEVQYCTFCEAYHLEAQTAEVFVDAPKVVEDTTVETPPIVALPEGDTEFVQVKDEQPATPEEGAVQEEQKKDEESTNQA